MADPWGGSWALSWGTSWDSEGEQIEEPDHLEGAEGMTEDEWTRYRKIVKSAPTRQ